MNSLTKVTFTVTHLGTLVAIKQVGNNEIIELSTPSNSNSNSNKPLELLPEKITFGRVWP